MGWGCCGGLCGLGLLCGTLWVAVWTLWVGVAVWTACLRGWGGVLEVWDCESGVPMRVFSIDVAVTGRGAQSNAHPQARTFICS